MRIIGDTHGKYVEYYNLAKAAEYSFQLGDFGFYNAWDALNYSDLDPVKHRVGQGNHDPHDIIQNYKHFVGRYGTVEIGDHRPFWIGGALSIDLVYRVAYWLQANRDPMHKTWWAEEQLCLEEMDDCRAKWSDTKPDLVISHTAPAAIINRFTNHKPGNILDQFGWGYDYQDVTSQFLSSLWDIHRPKLWVFGHFHTSYDAIIRDTRFKCLDELEYSDL
jgi:hypothetical protein